MGGIERGKGNVTLETLQRIARGLGLRASALLTEAEEEGRRTARAVSGSGASGAGALGADDPAAPRA